ncbi:NAD(P)H-quinone oxidoreductase subunit I [mine drainage metagenome]|uniref:NAD(P)H-quinone oxidoreductase subunit I n=1 Tax=mine drainage metagenome TaxID=410659 RepID=A0A1J5Q7B9_9ZZZZ
MTGSKDGAPVLRGTLALDPVACTSCDVCIRECPTKCMTLTSHVEILEVGGRRAKKVNVLDTFEIDFGLCMYCGICVDVCPHDALFWAPTPTTSESGNGARERLVYNIEALAESLNSVPRSSEEKDQ